MFEKLQKYGVWWDLVVVPIFIVSLLFGAVYQMFMDHPTAAALALILVILLDTGRQFRHMVRKLQWQEEALYKMGLLQSSFIRFVLEAEEDS